MRKSLIIDLREKELFTYLLEIKKSGYEVKESKKYPLSDRYDFSLDVVTEDIESAYFLRKCSVVTPVTTKRPSPANPSCPYVTCAPVIR